MSAIEEMIEKVSSNPEWRSYPMSSNLDAYKYRYSALLTEVQNIDPDTIVEVGACPYHFTYILQQYGYEPIGIDYDVTELESVAKKYGFNLREADIEKDELPVESETADVVLFSEVFEHLHRNPLFAVDEIYRVLRPGGRLLMTTPNLHSIRNVGKFLRKESFSDGYDVLSPIQDGGIAGHVREYGQEELNRILTQIGFSIEGTAFRNFGWHGGLDDSIIYPPIKFLFQTFPRLRRYQFVVAKKPDSQ